MKLQSC